MKNEMPKIPNSNHKLLKKGTKLVLSAATFGVVAAGSFQGVNYVVDNYNKQDTTLQSTNVVKSNTNRNKIITILSYLLIWAVAMIVFWFFTSGSDAMGYSLMFLWIILPVTTFVVSIVIGKNDFWKKGKWAFTLFFGVMYMLAEYGTFKMANNIAFDKLNAPDWGMIVAGAIISAIGMLLGSLCNKKRNKQKNQDI